VRDMGNSSYASLARAQARRVGTAGVNEGATRLFSEAADRGNARPARSLRLRYTSIGFVAAVAIVMLIALAAYQSIQDLRGQAETIDRTREVLIEIEELLSLCSNARIAWRTFLTGSGSRYPQEFESTQSGIANKVRLLRELISDNPSQQQRLAAFADVEDRDLAAMSASMGKKQSGALEIPLEVLNELSATRL